MDGNQGEEDLDARQRLLETAARLFGDQGFEAVSTRQLAKEAKVNIAMISYYFGSKEDLLKAIFVQKIPLMRSHLENMQSQNISAWDKLCVVVDLYVDKILSQSNMTKLIYRELSLNHRPDVKEFLLEGLEKNWSILYQLITEGQETGLFRESINGRMVFFTFFSTVAQMVNSRSLSVRLIGIKNPEEVFTPAFRSEVKTYFKDLLQAYLFKTA